MTPEQAFQDGYLEMTQKLAFCMGFLEVCVEGELDVEATLVSAVSLVKQSLALPVEPLKALTPISYRVQPVNTVEEWVRTMQNLSPPRSLKDVA